MGFRYPDEPPDGRPVIVLSPAWEDETERMTYEHAVSANPRREDEGAISYIQRISSIVTGRYQKAGLAMPRRGMSQREWERKRNALNRQAQTLGDPEPAA